MKPDKVSELKPCPFCGAQPNMEDHVHSAMGEHWIVCPNHAECGGTTRACGIKEAAIEAWNRRVAHPQGVDREKSLIEEQNSLVESLEKAVSIIRDLAQVCCHESACEELAVCADGEEDARCAKHAESYMKTVPQWERASHFLAALHLAKAIYTPPSVQDGKWEKAIRLLKIASGFIPPEKNYKRFKVSGVEWHLALDEFLATLEGEERCPKCHKDTGGLTHYCSGSSEEGKGKA